MANDPPFAPKDKHLKSMMKSFTDQSDEDDAKKKAAVEKQAKTPPMSRAERRYGPPKNNDRKVPYGSGYLIEKGVKP